MKLAAADPKNLKMQRELASSFEVLGRATASMEMKEESLGYHQEALKIAERLAQAEPDRADYQRDLSVSYNKMSAAMSAG